MSETGTVQRYWDQNAVAFDALYAEPNGFRRAFNAVFRKALFERIRLAADEIRKTRDASVLDVGCGSGRTTIPLARAGAKQVKGVDFAPHMIELARTAAAAAGVSEGCTFEVGDFRSDGVGGPFDYVTALGVFDYVDKPADFLRRMLSLSRSAAIFSVPKPSLVRANLRKLRYGRHGVNVYFYEPDAIERFAKEAGAASTSIRAIAAGYFVVCRPGG